MPQAEREAWALATTPRIVEPYVPHVPHPGPQQLFLCLDQIREVFYGGAAGGGKSDALLMAALQYVDVPGYAALLLRRTWTDLTQPGALMDRADSWLRPTDAKPIAGGRSWKFPSGARLVFGYVMRHADVEQYASAEYQFIGIDELSRGWEKRTYEFLFSRLRGPDWKCQTCGDPLMRERSTLGNAAVAGEPFGWVHKDPETNQPTTHEWCLAPIAMDLFPASKTGLHLPDVPLRMRSSSNPGGSGHKWVRDLFVDPEKRRQGAVYVPARLQDNPSLNRLEYERSLEHLGPTERERLLRGDWAVVEESMYFKRHWWRFVQPGAVPEVREWVRYWDLAATPSNYAAKSGSDPDWSVGALLGLSTEGQWYLKDVARIQGSPLEVERLVRGCAERDGVSVRVCMEQEPGSSGVNNIDHYRRHVLPGYVFDRDSPTGAKYDRAKPWSAAVESGNFFLVEGHWNDEFVDECELFPAGPHDDQVDAVSGAFKMLTTGRARIIA